MITLACSAVLVIGALWVTADPSSPKHRTSGLPAATDNRRRRPARRGPR